jgi:chorismate mutase-like protein
MPRTTECSSLEEVRSCIDAVDRELVRLLAERRGYVLQASRFKRTQGDVQAPARVEQVIAKVRALAVAEGIEPELVEAVYRQLVAGFIAIELSAHAGRAGRP